MKLDELPAWLADLAHERNVDPDRQIAISLDGLFVVCEEVARAAAQAERAYDLGYRAGVARGAKETETRLTVVRNTAGQVVSVVRMPTDTTPMLSLPVQRGEDGGITGLGTG